MLFGDRGELDDDISEVFSASGIAHLLAVSGLHVGFIVTLLSFVLGLCQAGDKTKFFVVSAVIYLCIFVRFHNFSYSCICNDFCHALFENEAKRI